MARPSRQTRNHQITVNGATTKIRTNFNVNSSRLSPAGFITFDGATTIQRMTNDGLNFDPRTDTSGNWNISREINLAVGSETNTIQFPYWLQNFKINKFPKYTPRQESLELNFGDALSFYDRETPEGDASQVDPAVGLPRWQVIQNLIQEVIPGATVVAAPGSSLPTETIRYPIDKNDRTSYIQQAGMLAFNSQDGIGFIYQSAPTQFSFFYYDDAIAAPAFTLTHRDVILEPEFVQPEEFVSPVEKLKVTGVKVDVLDINTTPAICDTTFGPFTFPDGTTVQRKIFETCTTTTVDITGLVFTTVYTKASITPGIFPVNQSGVGNDFKVGTRITTIDTYSAIDGLLIGRDITEERGYTRIVNGQIISHELVPYSSQKNRYTYGDDKLLARQETDYFHPVAAGPTGGFVLYDVTQNASATVIDPAVFVGTVIETWEDKQGIGFVHTVSLVLNADGTLNPARPTREYLITFNPPGRTIGIRDSQPPPIAETVPLPYELRQRNIERECNVQPINGSVITETRDRTINIRHVHSESQLQKAADWVCGMQWSRALSMQFVIPLRDELLTGIPIKRFNYIDENGVTHAYLIDGMQFMLSRHSCFVEFQAPYLGEVSGPTVTPYIQQQFKIPVLHESIDTLTEWINQSSSFDDYACIETAFAQ